MQDSPHGNVKIGFGDETFTQGVAQHFSAFGKRRMPRFHIAAGFERARRRLRKRICKTQTVKTFHCAAVRRDKSSVTELSAQNVGQQITAPRARFSINVMIR